MMGSVVKSKLDSLSQELELIAVGNVRTEDGLEDYVNSKDELTRFGHLQGIFPITKYDHELISSPSLSETDELVNSYPVINATVKDEFSNIEYIKTGDGNPHAHSDERVDFLLAPEDGTQSNAYVIRESGILPIRRIKE